MAAKLLINMAANPQLKKLQSLVEEYQQKLCLSNSKERLVRDHDFGVFNFANERFEIQRILTSMQASSDTCNSWDDILSVIGTVMKKREASLTTPFHSMLAKCIDKVKNASSDWSLKGIVNRLEMLSQEIGLQFDSGHTGTHCFISSDMFYVEVQLDSAANVLDVKVQGHSGDPRSSPELLRVLRNKDFFQFRTHLEGFAKLYRLQGNAIIKSKILTALEALESDINTLSKADGDHEKINEAIQSGCVGCVIPRIGGHSMQLMYCCDPILIANQKQNSSLVDVCRQQGYSVAISVESSELRQLASISIATKTVNQAHQFAKLDSNNSEKLPASFCLLSKDQLPLSLHLAAELHEIIHNNSDKKFSSKTDYPLDQLLIRQHNLMRKEWELSKGGTFTSILPDQDHFYPWIPSKQPSCYGILFSRVQFQHPSQVPKIIQILRRQAIFNTLMRSCFKRDKSNNDDESDVSHHFEFVMTSYNTLSVVFRHPIHSSLATVEFSVQSDCTITSSLRVFTGAPLFCSNALINRVVLKCLSIPITMRFIINKSSSYIPGSIPEAVGSRTLRRTEKKSIKLDRLKLNLGPHFGSQETGSIPLVSPGVYSATNPDHGRMMSPSSATLAFSYVDLLSGSDSAESPNRSDSSSKSSRKRDEKKLKPLPKITLKRKRDRNEYEIDKAKSTLDDLGPSDIVPNEVNDNDVDNDSMSFVYSEFGSSAMTADGVTDYDKTSNLAKDLDLTFSTATLPFEIPMDALSSSAINVNSVEGLEGLVLSGQEIDPVSLMGEVLPGELSLQGAASHHLEPFDLDNLSAGGAPLDFGVVDGMGSVSTSMIDPSAVVSTAVGMHFGQRLDVSDLMLDTMSDNPLDNL